jgi:Cu+-exporting ATPase
VDQRRAAVPLIVLTMGEMVGLPVRDWIGHRASYGLDLEAGAGNARRPVGGRPFFKRGWESIVNRSPNMWTLIALGVAAAYLYSLVATLPAWPLPEVNTGWVTVSAPISRRRW